MNHEPEKPGGVAERRGQSGDGQQASTTPGEVRTWRGRLHLCKKRRPTAPLAAQDLEGNPMKRLPSYDIKTSRVERGMFVSLSLVALVLIAITVFDAARFARSLSETPVDFSTGNAAVSEIKPRTASTNLTISQPDTPSERARVNEVRTPKS